jgi:hypothetical protein
MRTPQRSISYLRLAKKEIYPIVYRCHDLESRGAKAEVLCSQKLHDGVALKTSLEAAADYVDATFREWGGPIRKRGEHLVRRLRTLASEVEAACRNRRSLRRGRVGRFLQHVTRFFNSLIRARVACPLARPELMKLRLAKIYGDNPNGRR